MTINIFNRFNFYNQEELSDENVNKLIEYYYKIFSIPETKKNQDTKDEILSRIKEQSNFEDKILLIKFILISNNKRWIYIDRLVFIFLEHLTEPTKEKFMEIIKKYLNFLEMNKMTDEYNMVNMMSMTNPRSFSIINMDNIIEKMLTQKVNLKNENKIIELFNSLVGLKLEEGEEPILYNIEENKILYHGSQKIYYIQCFFHENEVKLNEFINKEEKTTNTNIEQFNQKYEEIKKKFYNQLSNHTVVSPQIFWGLLVLFCFEINTFIDLTSFLKQKYEQEKNFIYNLFDVYMFSKRADKLKNKNKSILTLLSPFYSSMKLSIQFFSLDEQIAEMYKGKGCMYIYNVIKNIELFNLNEIKSIKWLAKNVFTDKKTELNEDYVEFYTGKNKKEIFFLVLLDYFRTIYYPKINFNEIYMWFYFIFQGKTKNKYYLNYDIQTNKEILNYLWEEWNNLFDIPFFSEYGLFLFCFSNNKLRLNTYQIDALILSFWNKKQNLKGGFIWDKEIMINHPEDFGTMTCKKGFGDCPKEVKNSFI